MLRNILHSYESPNIPIIEKASMLLLAFYPILEVYLVGATKITLANFFGLLIFVITLFAKKDNFLNTLPKWYYIFWVYIAFQTYVIAGIAGWSDYLPGGIDLIIFSLIVMTLSVNFNLDLFYRCIRIVFIFAAVLFAIQLFLFYTTHVRVSVFLPLGNNLNYCDLTYAEMIDIHKSPSRTLVERFPSIFCETSYFAQYCLMVLSVELFYKNNRNRLFTLFSLIVAFIIILTQSGSGMVGLAIIAIMKLVQIIFITRKEVYYLYLLAMIPIAIWAISYYISTSMGASMMDRVSEIDGSKGEETSGFARIFLGWNIYDMLTPVQKVIGTDRAFMQYYWDGGFFNGITSLICSRGLIGLLLLIVAYLSSLRHSNPVCVSVLLIFLVISLFESTFLGGLMMLATTVAFGYKYKTQSNKM